MPKLEQFKHWARQIKRDTVAVYFAARDPRTPLLVRCLAVAIAAYALSPIDLIPDFIPILGYLDDLLIVPIGLWLVVRLLPDAVLAESRQKADALLARPQSSLAAAILVSVWIVAIIGLICWWVNR